MCVTLDNSVPVTDQVWISDESRRLRLASDSEALHTHRPTPPVEDDNLLRPALDAPSPPSPLRPAGGVLPMLMYGRPSGSSSIIRVSYTRICCAPSATGRGSGIHDVTLLHSSVKCRFTLFCCCLWGGAAGGQLAAFKLK